MGDLGGREGGEGERGRREEKRKREKEGRGEKGGRRSMHDSSTLTKKHHPGYNPSSSSRRTEVVRAAVEGVGQPPSFAVPASSISFSFCAGQEVHQTVGCDRQPYV